VSPYPVNTFGAQSGVSWASDLLAFPYYLGGELVKNCVQWADAEIRRRNLHSSLTPGQRNS
jgi:hypothetical protein